MYYVIKNAIFANRKQKSLYMKKIIEEQGVEIDDFKAAVAEEKPDYVPTPKNEMFLADYKAPKVAVVIGLVSLLIWAIAEFVIA